MRHLTWITVAAGVVVIVGSASAQHDGSPNTVSPDNSNQASINYPSVAAALNGLRARSEVDFTTLDGWTIVTEPGGLTVWSFTPPDHSAYPAVVKRAFFRRNGAWFVDMAVKCQAEKAARNQLVADFRELNEAMSERIIRRRATDRDK